MDEICWAIAMMPYLIVAKASKAVDVRKMAAALTENMKETSARRARKLTPRRRLLKALMGYIA
jgi:hypothetical protein